MEIAFSPPLGLTLVAAILGLLLATIVPTGLYLYVEPRGRRHWATAGDSAAKRRAPALVRLTAWLSFAVGQLAIPWLLVPVACAVLLYLQMKLGARPVGLAVTVAAGVAALVQSLLALRLLPLGVKLLVRNEKACARARGRARWSGFVSATVLGGAMLLSWAITTIPNFVHPWLRVALAWTALRPVMAYAALCLLHAMLLGRCARALCDSTGSTDTGN
jgi:hypothetical protein